MKLFIYFFALIIISCNQKINSDNDTNRENKIIEKDTVKVATINLPFKSENLNYTRKDKNGYFIYDNSFKNYGYSKKSRFVGKFIDKDVEVFLIELKPNGDEHIEPIISLFSYIKSFKKDSLIIYETINWEGSTQKRFEITKNKEIIVHTNSKGYDFNEKGEDTLIESKSIETYRISEKGLFTNNKWEGNTISNRKIEII